MTDATETATATAPGATPAVAAEATDPDALALQPHGGALRTTGKKGNKGGGRPKEKHRRKARGVLGLALDLLERDLKVATALQQGTLAPDQMPQGYAPPSRKDIIQIAEVAGRLGVGTESEKKIDKTETRRYVLRYPAKHTPDAVSPGENPPSSAPTRSPNASATSESSGMTANGGANEARGGCNLPAPAPRGIPRLASGGPIVTVEAP